MNKAFEKILERLEELRETYDEMAFIEMNTNGHTLDFEYAKGKKDVMLDVKKIVQEVAEEYNDGWIACSERLPERQVKGCKDYSNTVLISTDADIVTDAWYCFSKKTWYKQGFSIIGNVIAWQPLPEPYKERD